MERPWPPRPDPCNSLTISMLTTASSSYCSDCDQLTAPRPRASVQFDVRVESTMTHQRALDAAACMTRRRFLRASAVVCGAIGGLATIPSFAAASAQRSLRFVHTHTGEMLTAAYFDGSGYDDACLNNVNLLLRDFRTGESHRIDPTLLDILYDLQ